MTPLAAILEIIGERMLTMNAELQRLAAENDVLRKQLLAMSHSQVDETPRVEDGEMAE